MVCRFEDRIKELIQKRILIILALVSTVIAIIIRSVLINEVSGDMEIFLIPWYNTIKENGGLLSLKYNVGNYNILYQEIIALLTYLPVNPVYLYKFVSFCGDFLLAVGVSGLVYYADNSPVKRVLSYALTLNLPMVFLNSAMWGQCDSLYVSLCVFTLLYCFKRKYVAAMLLYGLSFALKLQSIFMLPFLLLIWIRTKKFSLCYFIIIPIVMIVTSALAVLQGRNIFDVFSIYSVQTTLNTEISMGYPSFWNIFAANNSGDYFEILKPLAIWFTVIVLSVICGVSILSKKKWNLSFEIEMCFLLTYSVVLFLPTMHERYDYLYVILSIIASIIDIKMILVAIGLEYINLNTYGIYLFHSNANWNNLMIINYLCYVLCVGLIIYSYKKIKRTES